MHLERKKLDGQFDQRRWAVGDFTVQLHGVSRLQRVSLCAVAVLDHTLEHVNELDPRVLKERKHLVGLRDRHEHWLDLS